MGLRKSHVDMCQRYKIKNSETGLWALPDIKKCYRKTQCILINTKKDGLSVTLVKQILRYLQNCETDKLQFENKVEKAKVRPLAEQLQNAKKDKGRLLNENNLLLQQVANFATSC